MPSIQYIDGQPFLIPDEVTELPAGAQPALPTQYDPYSNFSSYPNANQVAPPTYHGTEPQAVLLPTQPDMWAQATRAGKRLFGLGGEERYQTWPERTIRSALTLPAEVYQGTVQSGPGLRREDVTDIPGTAQPLDPLIERAQDVAGLAGGTAFSNVAIRGAEKNVLGVVPVAKARELNIKQSVPSEILKSAVENTPGAKIEPDGLVTIKVARKQSPEQEMSESVRGGSPELKKAVSEKGFPLFTGGLEFPKPLEQPTFDERWRDRVPDEMMKRDEIKDLLERQKIRNLPLDYTPPERKFEGRPVRLTKIDYTPEF